ncbi:MAG: hypothetical protein ABIT83_12490 [Massilia sp.]
MKNAIVGIALRTPGAFALEKSQPPSHAPAAPLIPERRVKHAVAAPQARVRAAPRPPDTVPIPPAGAATLLAQARRQADQGDFEAASASCQAALATDNSLADAYFILGLVSQCTGKNAAAAEFWRRCVYLQPDHYDALCHLALLADDSGDALQATSLRQRAARVYERTFERNRAAS